MRVQPFEPAYLPQLLELVNLHLGAVVPGWALSGAFLAEHLERDRTEPLTDPWVEERATLCAVDGEVAVSSPPRTCCATGRAGRWPAATWEPARSTGW